MTTFARMTGRVLRNGLPGLIALLLAIALFEFVQPVVIASFGGANGLNAIMARIPPALQVFMRARPEFLAMSGLAGYLSLGFTHPLYIILSGAAIVSFAARSLAGEMERGIIQIPLARPVSRPMVYASRVVGAAVICLLLTAVGPFGMLAGLVYARPDGEFDLQRLLVVALTGFALFWAVGGLSLCGSAAASTAGRVVGWILGILVFSYFIDYFAEIWQPLQSLTFLSLFQYYNPTAAIVTGKLESTNLVVLLLVGTVAGIAGLMIFSRRDLPA